MSGGDWEVEVRLTTPDGQYVGVGKVLVQANLLGLAALAPLGAAPFIQEEAAIAAEGATDALESQGRFP